MSAHRMRVDWFCDPYVSACRTSSAVETRGDNALWGPHDMPQLERRRGSGRVRLARGWAALIDAQGDLLALVPDVAAYGDYRLPDLLAAVLNQVEAIEYPEVRR